MHGGEERTRLYSYSSSLPLFTVFFSVSHSLFSLYSALSLPCLLFFLFSRCSSTRCRARITVKTRRISGTSMERTKIPREEVYCHGMKYLSQDSCKEGGTRQREWRRGREGGRMKGKINQTAYQAASLIVVKIDRRLYIPGPLARI